MGVGDEVGLRSRPRSRSSSACGEFNSKNVVLPTSSRNSRLYARFKTVRRDEYVQKHCDIQDKKHENTVLSGEREAAASVVRAAIVVTDHKRGDGVGGELANFHHLWSAGEEVLNPVTE